MNADTMLYAALKEFCLDRGKELDDAPAATISIPTKGAGTLEVQIGLLPFAPE